MTESRSRTLPALLSLAVLACPVVAAGAEPPSAATPTTPSTEPDDPPPPSETGPRLGERSLGFVGAVDLGPRPGQGREDASARVRAHMPAAQLRSLGRLGRFGALAPRPSGGAPIYLDGAPLSTGLSGVVELPSPLLDDPSLVEIHRGHVPVTYGAAASGEALDFVSQAHEGAPLLWLEGGFGSVLTHSTRAGFAVAPRPRPRLTITGALGYAGSRGDFPYFDAVGTPLLFGDDGRRRRASNHYNDGDARLRVAHHGSKLLASTRLLGHWRVQGVPGARGAEPSDASLTSFSLRSVSRVRRTLARFGYVEWLASVAFEGRSFRDREAEIGTRADDERGLSLDAWLSPRMRLPAWYQAWITLSAQLRGEGVAIRERTTTLDPAQLSTGDARRSRVHANVGVELEQWLYEQRFSLAPGLLVDLVSNQFQVAPGEGEPEDAGRDVAMLGVSPRLATKFELIRGLDLRGSVGHYVRPPTLIELFGDRGYLVGNEGLQVEAGTRVDGALVLALDEIRDHPVALFAQLTGFVTWSRGLIQWVSEGPGIGEPGVRPVNIEAARLRGLELSTSARLWHDDLALDLAYTLLDATATAGSSGAQVPGRPRHRLWGRVAGGHRFAASGRRPSLAPRLSYELEWLDATTLDLAGYDLLPARALHAVGVSLAIADRVEFGLEARGLAGVRARTVNRDGDWRGPYPVAISDLTGFPLPGTSLWATLRVGLRARQHDQPT